jgi:sulfate permease, SulP family
VAAPGSADYVGLAAALALMVGVVLVLGGLFRLGWIADLLSVPVTIGFLAGISAHIFISQLPSVLGLPSPDGPMLQRVAIPAGHVNEANPITLVIGLGVLAVLAVSERINEGRLTGAARTSRFERLQN